MKKILLFVLMVMVANFTYAQNNQNVDKVAESEFLKLTKIVTYDNTNIAFSKNQTVKIQSLLMDKAEELVALRKQQVDKADYLALFKKIEKKYEPKVQKLLTTEQRVEYRRNADKQISLKPQNHR